MIFMEWTDTHPLTAPSRQTHILTDDIHHVVGLLNAIDIYLFVYPWHESSAKTLMMQSKKWATLPTQHVHTHNLWQT